MGFDTYGALGGVNLGRRLGVKSHADPHLPHPKQGSGDQASDAADVERPAAAPRITVQGASSKGRELYSQRLAPCRRASPWAANLSRTCSSGIPEIAALALRKYGSPQ